ncbi:hypothetical protein B0T14DRAFT_591928 [Immersiella caudata]|uniref:Uncharacterized protein n=1 Tax=Immersiella caudata TaxID=314043 RepID=A0AA39WEI4_9PEZI|nr:hypothetical protein B0T14DRAFT_591928 [Immersiella caudata]
MLFRKPIRKQRQEKRLNTSSHGTYDAETGNTALSTPAHKTIPFTADTGNASKPEGSPFSPPQTCNAEPHAAIVEWIGEIIAMAVSIIVLLALAFIAYFMSGRPLADWSPTKIVAPISINAVISALAAASRGALAVPIVACISQVKWLHLPDTAEVADMDMFDDVSRGGLGSSAMLLFRIPTSGAALGALVTVLAYAMGPSYQHVIRLEERNVELPGNQTATTFSFAHEYNTGAFRYIDANGKNGRFETGEL